MNEKDQNNMKLYYRALQVEKLSEEEIKEFAILLNCSEEEALDQFEELYYPLHSEERDYEEHDYEEPDIENMSRKETINWLKDRGKRIEMLWDKESLTEGDITDLAEYTQMSRREVKEAFKDRSYHSENKHFGLQSKLHSLEMLIFSYSIY